MDLPAFTKGQRLCERFVLLEPLHSSANGSIWRALDEQRSSQAAIKCVSRATEAADRLWLSLQRQYALRQRLEHDHLLALEEPVRDGEALVLPMQLAAGNASRLRGKSWKQWQGAAIEVARALAHMHARGCVHGDLKPTNVLFDFRGEVLLADFETAAPLGERMPAGGSPFSASPARLRGEPLTIADDLYGFGALLHEWMTGYPPHFPDRPDPARWPVLPALQCAVDTPAYLQQLVNDLLLPEANRRPVDMPAVIKRLEGEAALRATRDGDAEIFDMSQVITATGTPASDAISPVSTVSSRRGLWVGAFAAVSVVLAGLWWILPRLTEMQSTQLTQAFAAAREAAGLNRSAATAPVEDLDRDIESQQITPAARYANLESSYLAKLADLEARAAGVWGGEAFAGGKSLGQLARDAADDKEWELALDRITVATRRLERVEELAASVQTTLSAEAGKALDQGQLELARQNFELLRQIDPTNNTAAEGLERVSALMAVLPVLADAESALLGGDALRAVTLYEQVLRADDRNRTATQGLQQATLALGNDRYGQAIGQALAELRSGDFSAADATLARAADLRPGAPEIAAVRAQLTAGRERRALDGERDAILALERAERWSEALTRYEQILARDPGLVFARTGRERVGPRARAEQRLNALIGEPARLSAPEVRQEAQRLLSETAAWVESGMAPVLTRQREALQGELLRYAVRIRAVIQSDGLTEVRIQRVGELGAFERKELQLQPGRYVAIGTRAGFRDVRREFALVPGESPPIIDVRCTEAIT
jgi:eukaryotic-like serine/threonine-protein kinase